jgi:hypothetical protein
VGCTREADKKAGTEKIKSGPEKVREFVDICSLYRWFLSVTLEIQGD